jgi:predicted alpha/beta-hydrolase family hydrolase
LHPPGKPEKLRVEHLPLVSVPILLVQGTRDPFGKPDEFARHLPKLPGPLTEVWIDANHSPKPDLDDEIVGAVSRWVSEL